MRDNLFTFNLIFMRSFLLVILCTSFFSLSINAQTCDGNAPVIVTSSIVGWSANGGIGDSGNSSVTLCGFPSSGNIVGLQWTDFAAITLGDSQCSDLAFYINGEIILNPFVDNTPGLCGPVSGGSNSNLQEMMLEVTADLAGCITIESFLTFLSPPVGVLVTAGSFEFTACPEGIVLPIELTDLSAINTGKNNKITWTTVSEVNNYVQMVNRSKDGISGWEVVGEVSGTNTKETTTYEVYDNHPYNTSFYRIHSIDFDGKEQFSKVVSLQRATGTGFVQTILPNPTASFIEIQFQPEFDDKVVYTVMDITGKIWKSEVGSALGNSENTFIMDMSDLNTGLYFVNVRGGGINQNEKIYKQ